MPEIDFFLLVDFQRIIFWKWLPRGFQYFFILILRSAYHCLLKNYNKPSCNQDVLTIQKSQSFDCEKRLSNSHTIPHNSRDLHALHNGLSAELDINDGEERQCLDGRAMSDPKIHGEDYEEARQGTVSKVVIFLVIFLCCSISLLVSIFLLFNYV